jgi:hypothetical protein
MRPKKPHSDKTYQDVALIADELYGHSLIPHSDEMGSSAIRSYSTVVKEVIYEESPQLLQYTDVGALCCW